MIACAIAAMKKNKPLKYRVVEIARENVGLFDLESWLVDLLVDDWLERNQEMRARQKDRCHETETRARKKNQ